MGLKYFHYAHIFGVKPSIFSNLYIDFLAVALTWRGGPAHGKLQIVATCAVGFYITFGFQFFQE
jgi:hypothetical protein